VENFVGRKFYGIEEDQTAIDGNRKSKRRAKSRDTEETGETAQGVLIAGGSLAALFTIAYLKGRADN
jgi:hypothetical protein